MAKTIDEKRLFGNIKYCFKRPEGVLLEIAQNAVRASAAKLTIDIVGNRLTAVDDGKGAESVDPLLCLSGTGWDENVVDTQNPAGWGLFYLMCIANTVKYTSKFGASREIDCDRYLKDEAYRQNTFRVDEGASIDGFMIEAALKEGIAGKILAVRRELRYFPMDIFVNGEKVSGTKAEEVFRNHRVKTVYRGNTVFINPEAHLFWKDDISFTIGKTLAIWYGIPIGVNSFGYDSSLDIVIDILTDSPLTPVLPYRTEIQVDERARDFVEFVRRTCAEYCKSAIESCDYNDTNRLVRLCRLAGEAMNQKELDALLVFYIIESEPYHWENSSGGKMRHRIVKREEKITSQVLTGFEVIDGSKREIDERGLDMLVLPGGTCIEASKPDISPAWLSVEEKSCLLEIEWSTADVFHGKYDWVKSSVTIDGKAIPVAGLVNCALEGTIHYTGSVSDVYEIDEAIFKMKLYSDDAEADSYETQAEWFAGDLKADIAKITDQYDLCDLLTGMRKAGIEPGNIRSLVVEPAKMEVDLTDGKLVSLGLATGVGAGLAA